MPAHSRRGGDDRPPAIFLMGPKMMQGGIGG